jgi:hypothetical protein
MLKKSLSEVIIKLLFMKYDLCINIALLILTC